MAFAETLSASPGVVGRVRFDASTGKLRQRMLRPTGRRHRVAALATGRIGFIRLVTTKGAGMASQYLIEGDRGNKEASQQLAVLRERWPLAFPVKDEDVRPLAIGATGEIAAVMDWSLPYTLGVLRHWKMAAAYCRAVLSHEHRITLDGAPAEAVGTEAKDLATKQLGRLATRKTAKKVAKPTAAAAVKPALAPTPPPETAPKTPEQLRDRVRASLLRRSA
jgi:sRNA-binding protein